MKIGLIDPALYKENVISPNIGDLIISRATHREIRKIFGGDTDILRIPSHAYPGFKAIKKLSSVQHTFVGGSNLLWFRWWAPASWKIGPLGALFYRDLILMGVGWGAYDIAPNTYGQWMSNLVLSDQYLHSFRDEFTAKIAKEKLKVGFTSNTACPTMWCLTSDLLQSIHKKRGDECIFSLTDYAKNPHLDKQLISDLERAYAGKLLFWPQGSGDLEYCRSLGYTGKFIDRSFEKLLELLSHGYNYDYVGTRLHAGILCLEHKVRSLIIAIDNRAHEIASDTQLPVIDRKDRQGLLNWIEEDFRPELTLPLSEISSWQNQFKTYVLAR